MKWIGIALLAVGVAVSAAYGARLSPSMRDTMLARGAAQFRAAETGAAKEAYCGALLEQLEAHGERVREIAAADGCEIEDEGDDASAPRAPAVDVEAICAARASSGGSFDDLVAAANGEIDGRSQTDVSGLGDDVAEGRAAWIAAARAEVEPAARAATLELVSPEQRVSEWAGDSGLPFGIGLLLVIVGAILGRVAAKRELTEGDDEERGDDAPPARDLGELLEDVRATVKELADEVTSNDAPSGEDFVRLKDRIHELHAEQIEPIVDSAPRIQAKYGLAVFADIFGPLSSAERYLNRAWSALVDQHWPEATSSVERAAADLAEAKRALDAAASD